MRVLSIALSIISQAITICFQGFEELGFGVRQGHDNNPIQHEKDADENCDTDQHTSEPDEAAQKADMILKKRITFIPSVLPDDTDKV
jgi:hypothetical protein